MKNKKTIIVSFLLFIGLLIILYSGGVIFFTTHFLSGTTINNVNVSCESLEDAINSIITSNETYLFNIETKDKSYTVVGKDIDLTYTIIGDIKNEIQKQNKWLWFMPENTEKQTNVKVDYSEEKLEALITNMKLNDRRQKPVNASIKFSNKYYIEKENAGNYFDLDAVINKCKSLINKMETKINIENEKYYMKPKITEEQLQPEFDKISKIENKKISITCVYDTFTIPQEETSKWIIYDNKKGIVTLDTNKINEYSKQINIKYSTLEKERTFVTSDKKEIKVSGGNYGWTIDEEGTTKAIFDALLSENDKEQIDAVYEMTGFPGAETSKESDIGNTYIEISIQKQHMWFYKNGKLIVETDVVTGNADGSHDTPKGVWYLWNKESPTTLIGADYATEVSFWMAVDWSGVGIHDSTWRGSSEYGGTTYKWNGSHGCINTPYDKVEKIYENTKIGTPVIIY